MNIGASGRSRRKSKFDMSIVTKCQYEVYFHIILIISFYWQYRLPVIFKLCLDGGVHKWLCFRDLLESALKYVPYWLCGAIRQPNIRVR